MANNGWVYDEIDGGSKQEFDHPGEIVLRRAMAVHCLHTTEGTSWPGYKGGASAPHFTIDPIKRQTRQHLPITEGARALRYRGRQTNTMGVAQYEIIGRASQMQDLPQSGIEYIAHVLGVVGKHTEIPAKSSVTFYPVGDAYGTHAKSRLPYAAFAQYRGILGHQHVPDNPHWDPGEFPIDKLVEAMTGETAPVKPTTEPHPTHPAKRPMVKVDGYWGENFTGALEEDFGHTVTGVVSSQSEYWEDDNPGLTSGWDWVRSGVVRGSRVFRKVQIWAGMPEDEQDGVGGPDSFGALQRKLRDLGYYTGPIDGEIWTESPTIKDFQRAHNDGKVK